MKTIEGYNYEIPEYLEHLGEDGQDVLKEKLKMNDDSRIFLYRIVGILTFLNVPQHTFRISRCLNPKDLAIVSFRYVTLADHDGLLALIKFVREMEKQDIKIIITGVKSNMKQKIMSIKGMKKEFYNRSWKKLLKIL